MAWTTFQQAAIDQRDADILVSAAAGSGKTAVLTERVLNRIIGSDTEEPIEIDRFLIVTFTSAAANEMKERISQKLADHITFLQEKSDVSQENQLMILEKIAYLEKQMSHIQTASISTIHSFCLKVIKAYFNKLDIDPNIKVASEAETAMMKQDSLEEIMEQKFESEDEDFLKVAEAYGSVQGMAPLADLILEMHSFSKSTPFSEAWLKEKADLLCERIEDIEETCWGKAIKKYVLSQIKDVKSLYHEAIVLCNQPNGPELYKEVLEKDISSLVLIEECQEIKEIARFLLSVVFPAFPRKKQACDEMVKEQVKAYRNLGKEIIKGLQEDLALVNDPQMLQQLPKIGEIMQALVQLIEEFDAKYQEAKKDAGVVDYNDLEHLCLKVLITPQYDSAGHYQGISYTDEARELCHFYKEIYIDEYQDSNTVQELILSAVAKADKWSKVPRFMVGDMKQSIYRFRLANPLIFADKYERFEKYQMQKEKTADKLCIDLSQNFRSRENILNGVNELFEQLMSKEVGELEYDDFAKLKTGNDYSGGNLDAIGEKAAADQIELHILETHSKDEESENEEETEGEDLKNVEFEALMTAELIDKLLKGEGNPTHLFDKELNKYRKVEPRDIVILLRATKEKAAIFENALLAKGISAYADVSSSFFEAAEIQIITALLKIIDNPLQDIPLLTVLRSPIVGASFDDLALIRKSTDNGCVYEALTEYLKQPEVKEAIREFIQRLQNYRLQSSELTIEELLTKLYIETGYYRYVAMLPGGAKKKANLDMLRNYAADFEEHNNGKLFSFIQYIERLKETSDGIGEAKLLGDNENLVRIMSIHKSKGLEFGIVFLCDTNKRFNFSDIAKPVLLHHELGFGPDYVDNDHYVKYTSIAKTAIKNQIISESISEELRVLYVALTRAKEKLFITGTVTDLARRVSGWSLFALREDKSILPLGVKKANTYLNWIGMSLFAHSQFPEFRDLIGVKPDYCFQGHSKWGFTLWNKNTLRKASEDFKFLSDSQRGLLECWDAGQTYGPYKDEIYKRLSFKYPYEEAVMLPTKLSVSDIKQDHADTKGLDVLFQNNYKIPSFMNDEAPIRGAQRGTLIHSVFEHLDLLKCTTKQEIAMEIEQLIRENKIQKEVSEVIDIDRLLEVTHSEITERMRSAKHVWKEKLFVYLLNAKAISEDYPESEEILIQGIIDTLFIEEGGTVIIDYKTDYIDLKHKRESINKIKERYSSQLFLYAKALEGITKMPVKEKYIYLYQINEWLKL